MALWAKQFKLGGGALILVGMPPQRCFVVPWRNFAAKPSSVPGAGPLLDVS